MRRPFAQALATALAVALAPCAAGADEPGAAAAAERPEPATAPAVAPDRAAAGATSAPGRAPSPPGTGLRRRDPLYGVSLGAGIPDLVNANFLVRPVPWLRLSAGPSWGVVAWGMQGGVAFAPWDGPVTPTLSFQAGTLFNTDLNRFVKVQGESVQNIKPLLSKVDYRYLASDLGLEFGSQRGLSFFLRLGLSVVFMKAHGTVVNTSSDGTKVTVRDPSLTAWMPSMSLGFQYWF
jgi:hypothetical protein